MKLFLLFTSACLLGCTLLTPIPAQADTEEATVYRGSAIVRIDEAGVVRIALDSGGIRPGDGLADVVIRAIPTEAPPAPRLEELSDAQLILRETSVTLWAESEKLRIHLDAEEDRRRSDAAPGIESLVVENALELAKLQLPKAPPSAFDSLTSSELESRYFPMTNLLADVSAWPGEDQQAMSVCQAGGRYASSCGLTCPNEYGLGGSCQVTCNPPAEACCQCLYTYALCFCQSSSKDVPF